jgi:hypothetical protein
MSYTLPELVQIDKHESGYVIRGYKAEHLQAAYAAGRASRDSAVRTLEQLGYTDEGGELWKPPIGKAPDFSLIDSLRAEVGTLQARVLELGDSLAELEITKDGAYAERNRLVSLLSKVFPSGKKKTAIEGWSEDWHGCVYIDLPTGQASWHYHASQGWLFGHLPEYQGGWDGHTTNEKYERIQSIAAGAQAQPLTDEQIAEIAERLEAVDPTARFWINFARDVEATYKIGGSV